MNKERFAKHQTKNIFQKFKNCTSKKNKSQKKNNRSKIGDDQISLPFLLIVTNQKIDTSRTNNVSTEASSCNKPFESTNSGLKKVFNMAKGIALR